MAGLGTEAPGFTADRKRDIMWGFYAHENYKKKRKKVKFHYQRFRKMKRKEEETEELCVKASI